MFPKKKAVQSQLKNNMASFLADFTAKEHWSISRCLTTEHLLSILSIANSFMNLQSFIDLQLKIE